MLTNLISSSAYLDDIIWGAHSNAVAIRMKRNSTRKPAPIINICKHHPPPSLPGMHCPQASPAFQYFMRKEIIHKFCIEKLGVRPYMLITNNYLLSLTLHVRRMSAHTVCSACPTLSLSYRHCTTRSAGRLDWTLHPAPSCCGQWVWTETSVCSQSIPGEKSSMPYTQKILLSE